MPKVKLGDVAKEYKSTIKEHAGLPIVGLEHMDPGELVLSSYEMNDEKSFSKGFKKGQILFGRRRAYLKKAAIAPFDGVCSGDIIVIEAIESKIMPELLPFIIQNDLLFDFAMSKSAGGMSPRVKWKDLKEYEFDLPEMEDQPRLLNVIKSAHDVRLSYKNLLQSIDDLVKSQFIEMFDPYKNQTKALSKIATLGPQNGFYRKGAEQNGTIPIVKMKQLFGNDSMEEASDCDLVSLSEKELERFRLTPNDLLFGRRSLVVEGAGKCRRVGNISKDMVFESSMLRLSLDPTVVKPRYLQMWFETENGKNAITAIRAVTTIAGIKGSDLANIEVPIAPMDVQDTFLTLIEQSDKSKFELKQAMDSIDDFIKTVVRNGLNR